MVAARRGHVFVLERHIGGSTWLVYDANGGRTGRASIPINLRLQDRQSVRLEAGAMKLIAVLRNNTEPDGLRREDKTTVA